MDLVSPAAPHHIQNPVMFQRWQKLTFIHWRFDASLIRPHIPPQLELDTFDGAAWVGLVPFLIVGIRKPWLPALPWISQFPETNVRTYVRGPDGNRGVWFFTLEADRLLGVWAARIFYHLPYRWAEMRVQQAGSAVRYRSVRKPSFGFGMTDIAVEPADPIQSGPLENFLSARFRLYSLVRQTVLTVPIEHKPWSLQAARVVRLEGNLFQSLQLPTPTGEPVVQYAADLQVRIGSIRRLS